MSSQIDTTLNSKEHKHSSHDHPLIYVDEENPKAYCSACGVAIISSPSYTCSQGCNFFLHQPCTELLQSAELEFGGNPYDISLLAKPPNDNCKCEKCGNLCKNFTYKCCLRSIKGYGTLHEFYLHCQCAFPLEINIKHISHHEHPLMAMCKEASLVCDACGRKQDGIFFSCQKCSFYIHQDCCSVPTVINIEHHPHPLFILYSLRSFKFRTNRKCLLCNDEVSLTLGAFVCGWCTSVAHIHCAVSAVENTDIVQSSIHLPSRPDTFSSLINRAILQNREDDGIEDVKSNIEKYHTDHSSWNFHNRESDDIELVCNACILPIISPPPSYYSCPNPQCFFLLHQSCANLPLVVKTYERDPFHLVSKSRDFCSVFFCYICDKSCNGFGYATGTYIYYMDVQCATSPNIVKHESHPQHLLTLSSYIRINFCCCDRSYFTASYSCGICRHHIHPSCAFLPKTVENKFDGHPLDLIYNLAVQIPQEEEENHYLCEFCEEDINTNFWFYYCGKCDHSSHINCIPSTGKLSKIKFGYNIDLPRHVHDHPVTLTRMLTMGSQRCGYCKDMIPGFVDDMAFHCSKCDFWIHFKCAGTFSGKQIIYYD
ncbi:uncharacterized protein [Primulina eburnea]|uniref:uncharacterized protein n=1 Tax=Primulina eburnea TaxID=1245227 RepID=UPI003C6C1483